MKKTTLLLLSVIFTLGSFSLSAQVIAGWDFSTQPGGAGNFGESPLTATTTDENVSIGGLSRGTGLIPTEAGTGAAAAWGSNNFTVGGTFESELEADKYYYFTVTPKAGYKVSFAKIGEYNVRRSASGPSTGQWQYQIGNGEFVNIGSEVTWGSVTTNAGNPQEEINLAEITDLQEVAENTTVTFRLVNYGATNVTGTNYLKDLGNQTDEDFIIYGTVIEMGANPSVITPVFEVEGLEKGENAYWHTATVTLSSLTDGASIFYTTDGSEPTIASEEYSEEIVVNETTTIKAIAVKTGMDNSTIAEKTITISGDAIGTLPYSEKFDGYLGDWYPYSVSGDEKWEASSYTSGDYTTFAKASGYNGGNKENEDWLISPLFTASDEEGIVIEFASATNYAGEPLALKYSTDYSAYTDPNTATWEDITDSVEWPELQSNFEWKESGKVEIAGKNPVYIAFVYTSTIEAASTWEIANIRISDKTTSGVLNPDNELKLYSSDNKIYFESANDLHVEIYNTVGKRIYQGTTVNGLNSIAVESGIVLVKIGNNVNKVLVK